VAGFNSIGSNPVDSKPLYKKRGLAAQYFDKVESPFF
jgi:hypothetical protein